MLPSRLLALGLCAAAAVSAQPDESPCIRFVDGVPREHQVRVEVTGGGLKKPLVFDNYEYMGVSEWVASETGVGGPAVVRVYDAASGKLLSTSDIVLTPGPLEITFRCSAKNRGSCWPPTDDSIKAVASSYRSPPAGQGAARFINLVPTVNYEGKTYFEDGVFFDFTLDGETVLRSLPYGSISDDWYPTAAPDRATAIAKFHPNLHEATQIYANLTFNPAKAPLASGLFLMGANATAKGDYGVRFVVTKEAPPFCGKKPVPPPPSPPTPTPVPPPPPPMTLPCVRFIHAMPEDRPVTAVLEQGGNATVTFKNYAFKQLSDWVSDFAKGDGVVTVYDAITGDEVAKTTVKLTAGPLVIVFRCSPSAGACWPPKADSVAAIAASYTPVREGAAVRFVNLVPSVEYKGQHFLSEASFMDFDLDGEKAATAVRYSVASREFPTRAARQQAVAKFRPPITVGTEPVRIATEAFTPAKAPLASLVWAVGANTTASAGNKFGIQMIAMDEAPELGVCRPSTTREFW